jgi:hypothetical protein
VVLLPIVGAGRRGREAVALDRSVNAGRNARAHAQSAGDALVHAVGRLVNRAIDEVVLSDERVRSAADGRRRLAANQKTETLAGDIQRVVVLALPIARRLARGARVTKVPWVLVGSTVISIGTAVRNGVREIQVLSSLVAYRLEQATGTPSDPALVKKVAIDLYLRPKRKLELKDDKLRIVRLTRKWVLSGLFGRKTEKRASRALDAAERFDPAELSARWNGMHERRDSAPAGGDDPAGVEQAASS